MHDMSDTKTNASIQGKVRPASTLWMKHWVEVYPPGHAHPGHQALGERQDARACMNFYDVYAASGFMYF